MVKLVSIGGNQVITGGNGIVDGHVASKFTEAMEAVSIRQFGNQEEPDARFSISPSNFLLLILPFFKLSVGFLIKNPIQ